MRKGSQAAWWIGAACLLGAIGLAVGEPDPPLGAPPSSPPSASAHPVDAPRCEARQPVQLRPPLEQPVQLSCEAARRVVAQARLQLVEPPGKVDPKEFAATLADWLDPHGLWSAAPDAPLPAVFEQHARAILGTLERGDRSGCEAARVAGTRLAQWVTELRGLYDAARSDAASNHFEPHSTWTTASEPIFPTGPVQRPARELAREFGMRAAALDAGLGESARASLDRLRARLFPDLAPADWGQAVLAAAVRAYVILIDPHGGWAPLDEETSLYEVELEASGRTRLWHKMSRSAVGLRIDEDPIAPLQPGDLVLAIAGIPTAGLSVEQAEQLGVLDPNEDPPERDVVVLRPGQTRTATLRVAPPEQVIGDEPPPAVASTTIPYADGESLLLRIPDVPDDLGDQIASVLADRRGRGRVAGVVIDLRGNGGGSTDGARAALGLVLPGVPLFPMRRRDGSVEIERATVPAETDRWEGPVAALVDGATASAAEMIAGALASYRRGAVLGTRTYGKGCAQEYMDDEAGTGVLRLTTLVYALPDGTPVQRVGLLPTIPLGTGAPIERETSFGRAPAPWRAPDMRDRTAIREVEWPSHGGRVGPCDDELVCRALRALGATKSASSRTGVRPAR